MGVGRTVSAASAPSVRERSNREQVIDLIRFLLVAFRRLPFRRPGGDLLFHALRRSTISAEGFHFRVRDGVGWGTLAITTRSSKWDLPESIAIGVSPIAISLFLIYRWKKCVPCSGLSLRMKGSEANRVISTGKLHTLLRFHTRPINVVVFHDSQGRTSFEGGFPLRCFQRLSRPHIATQLCRWRDNWSTRGAFTPVLSY